MSLTEDIIFSDPVLQRIFFDNRPFAPWSDTAAGEVAALDMQISVLKVRFLKERSIEHAEVLQKTMRVGWFAIRKRCAGYFLELPAGHDDGCQHVLMFLHETRDPAFHVDFRARKALWLRYARRSPPRW